MCLLYPEEWEVRFHQHINTLLPDYMTSHPTFRFCIVFWICRAVYRPTIWTNQVEFLRTKNTVSSSTVIHFFFPLQISALALIWLGLFLCICTVRSGFWSLYEKINPYVHCFYIHNHLLICLEINQNTTQTFVLFTITLQFQ